MKIIKNIIDKVNTPKLRRFALANWLPISGFFTFFIISLWFGFTFLADAIYFNDPDHQDDELKGWMTPKYVELSYELPRPVVLQALGLPEKLDSRVRMGKIASSQGISLEMLTERVRLAASNYRQSQEMQNKDET
ncbi:hypothetical protein OFY17_13965 [Marinomonas sp. C2222]|uniref:ABC transporter permease n=1 Tax=Marinomonas sargassi TaxID=2984494 RepID=A0ABT2YVQ9_9GAMM|nr:hypothetical protein [Marinomonas sargassi]MCV2403971.1 hypothetical protein [Marinomonas sargassi]